MITAIVWTGSAIAVFEVTDRRVLLKESESSSGDYDLISKGQSVAGLMDEGSIPLLFSIVGFVEVCSLVAMIALDYRLEE